jgi:hypothetical protein
MMAAKRRNAWTTYQTYIKIRERGSKQIKTEPFAGTKKGRKLRKCNWYCDNQVYLYCVLFWRVVRNEGTTNQILCEVRIVMLSEITWCCVSKQKKCNQVTWNVSMKERYLCTGKGMMFPESTKKMYAKRTPFKKKWFTVDWAHEIDRHKMECQEYKLKYWWAYLWWGMQTLNNKHIYRASKLRSMCEKYFYLPVNVTMMGE